MVKHRSLESLLKLLILLLTLSGIAVAACGVILVFKWRNSSTNVHSSFISDKRKLQLVRRLLLTAPLSKNSYNKLSDGWFIYLLICIGVILILVSCFGCIGVGARHQYCLCCYSLSLAILLLVEVIFIALVFLDGNFRQVTLSDKTGNFYSIYHFLLTEWKFVKWGFLVSVSLEVLSIWLSLYLTIAFHRSYDYSSQEFSSQSSYQR